MTSSSIWFSKLGMEEIIILFDSHFLVLHFFLASSSDSIVIKMFPSSELSRKRPRKVRIGQT